MSQQFSFQRRKARRNPKAIRRVGVAFQAAPAGAAGATAGDYPGVLIHEPEEGRRSWVAGSISFAVHAGAIALLLLFAALAPQVAENILEVQLIRDEPETARPAPMALAERALPNFAPQVQAVAPQIVNPHIISDASPVVRAEALQMDAVASIRAPTEISRSSAPVVERVSAVHSPIQARASTVDVQGVGGPAVRGPIKIDAPAGPSVGPRQVTTTSAGRSIGTGKLDVGGTGSSVREGRITGRDVVGTPTGAPVVTINTAVGDGLLGGAGGDGTGRGPSAITSTECFQKPEVNRYLAAVQQKTLDRWILPPGVDPDETVTLRFRIDSAGSATKVSLVDASSNALGASAVDALRSAAPFPPIPDDAGCLARVPIVATFSNPVAG